MQWPPADAVSLYIISPRPGHSGKRNSLCHCNTRTHRVERLELTRRHVARRQKRVIPGSNSNYSPRCRRHRAGLEHIWGGVLAAAICMAISCLKSERSGQMPVMASLLPP